MERGGKKERDPGEGLKLAVLQTLDSLLRLPRDRTELAAALAAAQESPPGSCNPDELPELGEGASAPVRLYSGLATDLDSHV